MALDFTADTAAIYNTADFAMAVTFTTSIAGDIDVNAIFTEPAEIFEVVEGQMTAVAPTLMVPTSEITDVRKGDTVSLTDGSTLRTFTIERIQKCGTDDSVCYLKT